MLENVQVWIYGAAALIDTVLLFALLERHNWRGVTVWMVLLAVGVWSWHCGSFVRQLVDSSVGPLADPVRWLSMVWMTFGLMLMPSAALHAVWRLRKHGQLVLAPTFDPRLLLCYVPLFFLIPMSRALATNPSQKYLDLLIDYHIPYSIWLTSVSVIVATGLFQTARQTTDSLTRRFYHSIAASLLLISALTLFFFFCLKRGWSIAPALQTAVGVSPIIPALLFAYFVMRFQLLPLILERTLAYGVLIMGTVLFHQLVLRDVVNAAEARYRLNFGVLEGVLALMIILMYQPLRYRVAEALQTLLESTSSRRSRRQYLAVQLAARAGEPVPKLFSWFTETLHRSFSSDLGAAWLCEPDGAVTERVGAFHLLQDDQVKRIIAAISSSETPYLTRYSICDPAIIDILEHVRAGAVIRFAHADLSGLFLIGCRKWGQPPSEEDLHALSLLVEQFGVTLHNSRLQATQLAAEQRILQHEKLSTLGLIAGSLAHEIKNPLSTIKTITRVLSEDLGPSSPHAEDLRMITGEIDRLSVSTSELLEAARPPREGRTASSLCDLLSPTLRLLQHLARERQAKLDVHFPDQMIPVPFDQISLREVVFNLVSNGLEAAGAGGSVCLTCRHEPKQLVIEVHDTGPGFTAEQRPRMFEPFFTTKPTGTGLGLYIVARRVKDLGGQIECQSIPQQGTLFSMRFPLD